MISSNWRYSIGFILIVISVVLGTIHYWIFHDVKTEAFYLALDIVFVPIQVLLVTVIIEKMMSEREKLAMLNKLNMVIGAFYSEVGNELLKQLRQLSQNSQQLDEMLKITREWKDANFADAKKDAGNFQSDFRFKSIELSPLKELMIAKRSFMLGLLQNPNLLEHDKFTDLLWAVLHLSEELTARSDLNNLPSTDLEHIYGDINRAFGHLISEWLQYMKHLRDNYPYLYSLAIRTNPFNPEASVEIK
jgi:hypothetical protein